MKTILFIGTFLGASAFGAEQAPDLTGQDVAALKAHDGQIVALHGKLRKPAGSNTSASLIGLGGKGVLFYISEFVPPEGRPSWPKEWADLVGQRVLVTGKLHFTPPHQTASHESSPGFFYMEQNSMKIEPLKEPHR